jgi:hypothetical protein
MLLLHFPMQNTQQSLCTILIAAPNSKNPSLAELKPTTYQIKEDQVLTDKMKKRLQFSWYFQAMEDYG